MLSSIWIDLFANRVQSQCTQVLHFLQYISLKVDFGTTFLDLSLEVGERKLIAIFVAAVLGALYLDRVIGQVHKVIVQVLCIHRVGLTRGAQIAFFEEVNIHVLSESHPDTNVKFPLVHKQRPFDILLNDKGL